MYFIWTAAPNFRVIVDSVSKRSAWKSFKEIRTTFFSDAPIPTWKLLVTAPQEEAIRSKWTRQYPDKIKDVNNPTPAEINNAIN